MRNSRLIISGLTIVAGFSLSSCALPQQPLLTYLKNRMGNKVAPLKTGTRYEVRKALASNVPFRPSEAKGYTFVFEAPRPPLMAASRPSLGAQMRVRTTAYCHNESDHIVYGRKNAVGTTLKFGNVRSAAADWSRFPVGTQFRIQGQPDVIYVVDDYGSALVGTGTIDLYKPSRAQMNDWGVRHVDIEVIHWGSYEHSMELMRDRTKWKHVRQMIDGIQDRLHTAGLSGERFPVTAAL
jgi:3D (Asp-Asp-Asp) domain-containing protein